MNIVTAFLELDKVNESIHQATGIEFPEVVLSYEGLEIEYYFENDLITEIVDYEYHIDGLDVAAVLAEHCINMTDYPEFYNIEDINSLEADEWLIDHWEELLEKYDSRLLNFYELDAKENAADIAYASRVAANEEI